MSWSDGMQTAEWSDAARGKPESPSPDPSAQTPVPPGKESTSRPPDQVANPAADQTSQPPANPASENLPDAPQSASETIDFGARSSPDATFVLDSPDAASGTGSTALDPSASAASPSDTYGFVVDDELLSSPDADPLATREFTSESFEDARREDSRREEPSRRAERPDDGATDSAKNQAGDDDLEIFIRDDLDHGDLGSVSQVNATWSEAARDAHPGMTIKPSGTSAGAFTSSLVIQPRVVSDSASGEVEIADYDLLSRLGEGGMGVVYTARQSSIDRTVALKMLKPGTATSDESQQKFLAEAVVTGELDHPNIVPIYDLGRKADGTLFYSMKKIQGTPWMNVIGDKSLSENLDILMRVADAVAFAHSRGVIHRDLKPENVMLGEFGETLLLDWGLAMTTADCRKADTLPASKTMGGTPSYMAPEMILGPLESIGKHSDIYLLGAILYECVTGSPPHVGKTAMLCILAAGKNEIAATDKSGELVDIARKAMATAPEDRYASVQEFQAAVRDYQSHSESIALTARAEQELRTAQDTDDYNDFAKALYVFEEAYSLWTANQQAQAGIRQAQQRYAESAYRKGDYDLGLSVLDAEVDAHRPLMVRLQQAREERDVRQQRLNRLKKAVVGMAVLVFLAVTIGMLSFLTQKREADRQRAIAVTQKNEADRQREEAERQRTEAEKQRNAAVEQRLLAEANRQEAFEQRIVAEQKTREAEYEAYLAWIGLAAEKIDENALGQARQVLGQCSVPLRDWEFARLVHQCRQGVGKVAFGERLESLAVSDDGATFAVGSRDGIVRVVDRASSQVVTQMPVPGDYPSALAFRPGSNREILIGTGQDAGTLLHWNWESVELTRWAGHDDRVTCIRFSRDGTKMLTASYDQTAKIWQTDTKRPVVTMNGHNWWVWSAEFSPDESLVVTAGQDGTVRLWDSVTGQQLRRDGQVTPFRGHAGPVFTATFAPDGRSIASGGYDNRVLVWRIDQLQPFDYKQMLATAQVEQQPATVCLGHAAAISSLAYSDDGRHLLSASHDNAIKVWSVEPPGETADADLRGILVKTLRGHDSPVRSLRVLPATFGQLASVGHDGDLRTWDIQAYSEQQVIPGMELRGHVDAVLSATFSSDGQQVVTASRDRTARTWNTTDGRSRQVFREGHAYLTSRAAVFADGQRLMTAAVDGTVRVWNMSTGAQELSIDAAGYRAAAAVSPNGQWIATGSNQIERRGSTVRRSARLWDARTGELLREFTDHKTQVTAVEFSPDSRWLFSGDSNGRGNLWDVQSGKLLATMRSHTAKISDAKFSADGQQLLTASDDNTVFLWTLPTDFESNADGDLQASADEPAGARKTVLLQTDTNLPCGAAVSSVAVSQDGELAVTGCEDGTVQCWELAGQRRVWSWKANGQNGNVSSVSIAARAPLVAAVDAVNNRVYLLDLKSGRKASLTGPTARIPGAQASVGQDSVNQASVNQDDAFLELKQYDALAWYAVFTSDGTGLITAGGDEARWWDLQAKEQLSFRPHRSVTFASFSPDATRVVTAAWDRSAKIWDVESGQALLKLADHVAGDEGGHQAAVNCAVFSPDGQAVLTASDDGTLKLWDATSGRVLRTYRGHTAGVTAAQFSPDGQQFVSTSRDATARIWLTSGNAPATVLSGHQGAVTGCAFSPDAARVATSSEDRTAIIWDVAAGLPLRTLAAQTDRVTAVAFSPTGTRLLTGCADHSVKLWDTGTGREVLTLAGHQREVTSVGFSPDGRSALSSSRDGTAILWPTVAEPLDLVRLDVPQGLGAKQ